MSKVVAFLLVTLWTLITASAIAGQDTRGTDGVRIQLLDKLELKGEVLPWDRVQFQKAFRPVDQKVVFKLIDNQIQTLKKTLPRFAIQFEKIITQGINPTWYFVDVELKPRLERPQSNLVLTYQDVRIADHDGKTVRINRKLWEEMTDVSRSWTLVHETFRTVVEVMALQDDVSIAMLTALFMHDNLATFEKKELAKAFLSILRGDCEREGFFQSDSEATRRLFNLTKAVQHRFAPESPLIRLIEADINVIYQEVGEWEDRSTRGDGLSGTSCTYSTDQCVFRDRKRGPIYWSQISPAEKSESEGINLEVAKKACSDLKKWGGFSDWRLPTFSELYDVIGRIYKVVDRFPYFGQNNNVFLWASTAPQESSWWMLDPLPKDKAYAINLAQEQDRDFDVAALNSYRCVHDEYSSYWLDDLGEKKKPGENWVVSKRSGFLWTGASPKFIPDYGLRRRHDDLGYVSRRKAERTCQELNWAGEKGWRLPTPEDIREAHADGLLGYSLKNEKFGVLVQTFWVKDLDGDPSVSDNGFSFEWGQMVREHFDSRSYPGLRRYVCVWDGVNKL